MIDSEWSLVCLVINVFIWVVTFIIFQIKTKYFGVGSAIILLYTIISIFAIDLYCRSKYTYGSLTLLPLIYLYGMIMIASSPILYLQRKKIEYIHPPNQKLLNIVCIAIILFSFVSLPRTITLIKENLFAIILDTTAGSDLYDQGSMVLLSKSSSQFNIIAILGGICGNVALVFFMYYLTIENRNKYIFWGLGISCIIGPIASVANGSRYMLAVFIFNSSFLFIFIRNFIKVKLRKKITRGILISGIILLIPFATLTLSRNKGDSEKAIEMVEDYLSQGFLNFNKYGLDAGGTRQGDYTVVVFKYIAQLHPAMYYSGRINKYWNMKLNESKFYTFVGDFTLDYGPILALLIFVILALGFRRIIRPKKKSISFQQYLIVYLIVVTCIGYYQFTLGREEGNLNLIALLALSLIFKVSNDLSKRKKNKKSEKESINCHGNI